LTIELLGTETLNKNLGQIKISVLKYIKSNAVLGDSQEVTVLKDFFSFTDNMLLFSSLNTTGYQGYRLRVGNILVPIIENNRFEDFQKFLKRVDLDSNIAYEKRDRDSQYELFFTFKNRRIDYWRNASSGTRAATLFYYWFQFMKYDKNPPSFVFVDEFDAFYHIGLAKHMVEEIMSVENCQIILTTHDTSIMTNDLLRPDCYFFMYKNKIVSLADSTDKELRQAHNLEKMYRSGIFNE
jgi:hypothetical protein